MLEKIQELLNDCKENFFPAEKIKNNLHIVARDRLSSLGLVTSDSFESQLAFLDTLEKRLEELEKKISTIEEKLGKTENTE